MSDTWSTPAAPAGGGGTPSMFFPARGSSAPPPAPRWQSTTGGQWLRSPGAPGRKELGVRTLFNILGPLTNPAGAKHQVMGVFHPDLVGIQVRVLQRLGSKHVMVVYGLDGLDEISISGETLVGELVNGEINE